MKRALFCLFAVLLCLLTASFGQLAFAEETAGTTAETAADAAMADGILTYRGLSARKLSDKYGVRSLYEVRKEQIKALEEAGYTVAYGAIAAIGEQGTNAVNALSDVTVTLAADGSFTPSVNHATAVTVYATAGSASADVATGLYVSQNSLTETYAYTIVYQKNVDTGLMRDTGLVFRAFFYLEAPDGSSAIRYVDATGEVFGGETAIYGVSTTLYEVSEYLACHYKDGSGNLPYAHTPNFYQILLRCDGGMEIAASQMSGGTEVPADPEAGTLYARTLTGNGSYGFNDLSFTVQAEKGFYRFQLLSSNKNQKISYLLYTVNGRAGGTRLDADGKTTYSLTEEDTYTDASAFYAYLDEGVNTIRLYMQNASSDTALSVAAVKMTQLAVTGESDICQSGIGNMVNLAAAGVTQTFPSYIGNSTTSAYKNGAFKNDSGPVYKLEVRESGNYVLRALLAASTPSLVLNLYTDANCTSLYLSKTNADTGSYKMSDGSQALVYKEICGLLYLEAGTYYYTLHGSYQLTLSTHSFAYCGVPSTKTETYKADSFRGENPDVTFLDATDTTVSTALIKAGKTMSTTVHADISGVYRIYATWAEPRRINDLIITTADGYGTLYRSATYGPRKQTTVYDAANDADTLFAVPNDTAELPMAYLYLEAGDNTVSFKVTTGAVGISALRYELVSEASNRVISLGARDGTIVRPAGVTSGGFANETYGNQRKLNDAAKASIQWEFTVPVDGTYDIFAHMSSGSLNNTVTVTVSEADAGVIDTKSLTFSARFPECNDSNGAYAMCYTGPALVYADFGKTALEAGKTYTVNMVGTGTSNWNIGRLLLTKGTASTEDSSVISTYYPAFTAGSVTEDGVVDSETAVVSRLFTVPKAGTVVRVCEYGFDRMGNVVSFSQAGTYPISVWRQQSSGEWQMDTTASVEAGGYNEGTGRTANNGCVTYTYITQADNETLRVSYAAGTSDYYEAIAFYASEAVKPVTVEEGNLLEDNEITLSSLAFGETSGSVTFHVAGKPGGNVIVAYYGEADTLLATESFAKTAYKATFSSSVTTALPVVTIRIYPVTDESTYTPTGETLYYSERSGSGVTVMLPAGFYALSEEVLTPDPVVGTVIHLADTAVTGTAILTNGTYILPVCTSSTVGQQLSFSYTAPVSGYYAIRLHAEDCGSYQRVYLYNSSVNGTSGFGGYQNMSYSNASNAGTAESDADYVLDDTSRYAFFTGNVMYQYLQAGQNTLIISHRSNAGAKLGVSDVQICLMQEVNTADAVILPYAKIRTAEDNATAGGYASNRSWQEGGLQLAGPANYLYQKVVIAKDGLYRVSAMMNCASGNTVTISDAGEKIIPISCSLQNGLRSADWIGCGFPVTVGEMMLKAGTYYFKIQASVGLSGLSFLAFERTGDYDVSGKYALTLSGVTFDESTGLLSASCYAAGYSDGVAEPNAGVIELSVYQGDVMVAALTPLQKTSFTETFSLSESLSLAVNQIYTLKAFYKDADGNLLSSVEQQFSTYEGKLLFITDVHFSGSNDYVNGQRVLLQGSYRSEAEYYGFDNELKLQLTMDELILMYKNGEFDMLFVDGDVSRNDSFIRKFMPYDIRYWNAYKYRNTYDTYEESYAAAKSEGIAKGLSGDELTAYAKEHSIDNTYFLGTDLSEFWNSPFDNNAVVVEKFFSQLTAEHIPYFLAIGNHDWEFTYDYETNTTDWTPWENLMHYKEIFGYDYDDYLVRMISVDGEKKILTVLSDEKLAEYKAAGYTYYTNENELMGKTYKKICSVAVFNNFDYVYQPDATINSYGDITIYTGVQLDVARRMMQDAYPVTYLTAHMFNNGDTALQTILSENDNIKAMVYGDAHTQEESTILGRPSWCAGCVFVAFDFDKMQKGDGTADNSYYYSRGTATDLVWANMERHPWSMVRVFASDMTTVMLRENLTAFYENGKQALTQSQIVGRDVRYIRARLDASDEAYLSTLTFTDATGTAVWHIGAFRKDGDTITGYDFYDAENNFVKTVESLAFSYLKDGDHVLMIGNEVLDVDGVTMRKGYLYDENRNYVYVDESGKYVYIDFQKDANGEYLRQWFYISNDAEYLLTNPLGYKDIDFSQDQVYTDVATVNDEIGQKYFSDKSWFNVATAEIDIQNGGFYSGEGFAHYNYVYTFSYADGTAATPKEDLDADGNTVYGLYIPMEQYHELTIHH